MADKEYIERGELLREIDNRERIIWSGSGAESQAAFDRGFYRGLVVAAPTADVVEVVRCKDCKWWNKAGCAICIVDETDKPKENDFCSFGEKMDGKGESE